MSARILDGRLIAKTIIDNLKVETQRLRYQYGEVRPSLAVIQLGQSPDSTMYIRMKEKAAKHIDFQFRHILFPEAYSEFEVYFLL